MFFEKDPDGETVLQDERVSASSDDPDVDEVNKLIASGKTAEDIMEEWERQVEEAARSSKLSPTTAPSVDVESIDDDYTSLSSK